MEKQNNEIIGEGSYLPNEYKQFEIYNANREEILIDTLSDEQVKHSGRIVFNDDDFETTSLIRFMYNIDVFDFLTRKFYVMGRKINLSTYFSTCQFQSGILDIPFSCNLSELGLKIPLKYREFCNVIIFAGNAKQPNHHNHSMIEGGVESLFSEKIWNAPLNILNFPKREVYAVIKNTTSKSKEINIIDLAQGKNIPQGVVIENSAFNLEGGNDFELMRVWSKNNAHLCEDVFLFDGDAETKITTQAYFTANQFQSNMIDVPYPFKITPESKIMVNLPSNARTMYSFL